MNRPILHIAVDMQVKYLGCAPPQLPKHVNQFALDLYQRGVQTIWVAGSEVSPPLISSIDDIGMKLYGPEDQLDVSPNKGDLFCLKCGTSAFCNPHLGDYLARFNNPLIVVTGVRADACLKATVWDVVARGYDCYVPLDLIAGVGKSKARYNSPKFWQENQNEMLDVSRRMPEAALLLSPGIAEHFLTIVDNQMKRPTRREKRPLPLDFV